MEADSTRRLAVTLAGIIAALGNKHLDLNLSTEEVLGILGVVATYVASSNWKSVKKAEAAGATAAASIITVEQANAIMEEAARRFAEKAQAGAKVLVALLCVGLALLPVHARAEEPALSAPPAAVCIPAAQRVNEGKAMIDCITTKAALEESLKKSTPLHPIVTVTLIVLGVVAGGAAGFGIAKATSPTR